MTIDTFVSKEKGITHTSEELQVIKDIFDNLPKNKRYILEPWGLFYEATNKLAFKPKYEGEFPAGFLEKNDNYKDDYNIMGVEKW